MQSPLKQQNAHGFEGSKEWVSWKIKTWSLLTFLILTVLLIATIVVLFTISQLHHGFVQVSNISTTFAGLDWKASLLWISLPSLVFQAYGLCFGDVIDTFGFRQPFVELARGASASKTIALNYSSYMPVKREWKAFRNGHWHIGFSFTVALIFKTILGPLAARLLYSQPYSGSDHIMLIQNSSVFTSSSLTTPIDWDLDVVLSTTASTRIYGGNYPRWTDGNQYFLNFSVPDLTQSRVSAATEAYYATIECEVSDLENHILVTNNSESSARFYLNGTNNDCDWKMNFGVTADFTTYMRTDVNTRCGGFGNFDTSGRLIVVAGTATSAGDYELNAFVCVPQYWKIKGVLTLDSRRDIESWVPDENTKTEIRPDWWSIYEQQLEEIQSVDPTKTGAISATRLGRLIRDNADSLDPTILMNSTQEVYATLFSTVLSSFLIRPAPEVQIEGMIITTHDRLLVSNAIAGVLLTFLTIAAGILVIVLIYTKNHQSILFEEPIGLVGYAGILKMSVLNRLVESASHKEGYRGKTRKDLMELLGNSSFHMVDMKDPHNARIVGHGNDEEDLARLFS